MNIFCVDDVKFHRQRSKELVEQVCSEKNLSSVTIFECKNGAELIDQAKDHPPSLVMMDINMPEMDGLSALVKFRSLYPGYSTKIVMVSSENKKTTGRLASTNKAIPNDINKKKDLLNKVIERVKSGNNEPGKINSVLEACANLDMDPVEVAKDNGANGFISKPFDAQPTSEKLAKFL